MILRAEFALAAALLGASAGCASAAKTAATPVLSAASRRELAERVSAAWSEPSRLAARRVMALYGPPDEVGAGRLTWRGNGPWKRTVVRNRPRSYAGDRGEDLGVLEQTVDYGLTPEEAVGLAPFSRRLRLDPGRMEMTSRSDREETNFLRLNLADDVLRGRMTAWEAKDSFERVLRLESSGKTSRYLLELSFGPKTP